MSFKLINTRYLFKRNKTLHKHLTKSISKYAHLNCQCSHLFHFDIGANYRKTFAETNTMTKTFAWLTL